MIAAHGYVTITMDGKVVREVDTYQCAHCMRHNHLKPKEPPFATCKLCMGFVCDRPACNTRAGCTPSQKWLEEEEKRINLAIERQRFLSEALHG
jgi:hypothetical protein